MQKLKTPADVLIKVEQFDPQNCIEATAQKADGLIAGETEESIATKSLEAVIIYKWVRTPPLSLSLSDRIHLICDA